MSDQVETSQTAPIDPEAGIASLLDDDGEFLADGEQPEFVPAQDDEVQLEADPEDTEEEVDPDADETEEVEAQANEPLYPVTIDGKVVQVPQSELLANYVDKQTIAAQKAEVEQHRTQFQTESVAVQQERTLYKAALEKMHELTTQELNQNSGTPEQWAEFQRTDPTGYLMARENQRALEAREVAIRNEHARMQQEEQVRFQQARKARQDEQGLIFRNSIPEWKDQKVVDREIPEIAAYARSVGFTDADLANADDARTLLILYKAMKHDQNKAAAKNLKPIQRSKTLPTGSPQRGVASNKSASASKRLAKSGSTEDFAAMLEQMDI